MYLRQVIWGFFTVRGIDKAVFTDGVFLFRDSGTYGLAHGGRGIVKHRVKYSVYLLVDVCVFDP